MRLTKDFLAELCAGAYTVQDLEEVEEDMGRALPFPRDPFRLIVSFCVRQPDSRRFYRSLKAAGFALTDCYTTTGFDPIRILPFFLDVVQVSVCVALTFCLSDRDVPALNLSWRRR